MYTGIAIVTGERLALVGVAMWQRLRIGARSGWKRLT
jgi:hypothetical protein